MAEPMVCNECDQTIEGDMDWIMLTIKDDSGYSVGFLCSTDHLVDYVAVVKAMEHDKLHPRWEDDVSGG